MSKPSRTAVCLAALGMQGWPYIFGGQRYKGDAGTDCSGLVGDAFYLAGYLELGRMLGGCWTAHRFATECPRVEVPEPGDLWCYLGAKNKYSHVTFCLGQVAFIGLAGPTSRLILNATGGAPDVTTVEIAHQRRARIVLLQEAEYHKRRLPAFAVSLAQFYRAQAHNRPEGAEE